MSLRKRDVGIKRWSPPLGTADDLYEQGPAFIPFLLVAEHQLVGTEVAGQIQPVASAAVASLSYSLCIVVQPLDIVDCNLNAMGVVEETP